MMFWSQTKYILLTKLSLNSNSIALTFFLVGTYISIPPIYLIAILRELDSTSTVPTEK